MSTKSITKLVVALYNHSVHSSTKYTPNELLFNQNNINNPEDVIANAQKLFREAIINMEKSSHNQTKYNHSKEEPPPLNEGQEIFLKPNIRTKTQPRGNKNTAHNILSKTFKNSRNIKRHKQKLKRLKKKNIIT